MGVPKISKHLHIYKAVFLQVKAEFLKLSIFSAFLI